MNVPVPLLAVVAIALLVISNDALAHNPFSGSIEQRIAGSISALLLLSFWWVYVRGSNRVSPGFNQELGFYLICVICGITILGPLDELASNSTAAHMSQHMLLIVVIAPLWVLTRPLPQLVAGGLRLMLPFWKPLLRLVRQPMTTAYLHGAAIWIWHIPWFYMLAVESPGWHTFEHACFLVTAGLFWWAVLRCSSRNLPTAALALLFTLMHTGFLGAILTFARLPLYDESRTLADQQLAGLIMWVAGAFPYLLGISWLARRWYRRHSHDG
ncbi:MAG: cytochrome c oxidase assembly protein [Pseudohongiella sp.]|nr:cytochrome c oxidase assembly protein [Pseudohongiella sp.]